MYDNLELKMTSTRLRNLLHTSVCANIGIRSAYQHEIALSQNLSLYSRSKFSDTPHVLTHKTGHRKHADATAQGKKLVIHNHGDPIFAIHILDGFECRMWEMLLHKLRHPLAVIVSVFECDDAFRFQNLMRVC